MKKIGIVTLYNDNYGSILQCYSTKKYVEKLGYIGIIFSEKMNFWLKIKNLLKHAYRSVRYKKYFYNKIKMKKSMKKEINYLSNNSRDRMHLFVNEKIQPLTVTFCEAKSIAQKKEYSKFIVGSDQVWNASREISDFFFLRFAPIQKRITLAPSFGVSEIPNFNKRNIKEGLKGFKDITIREENAEKIVYNLIKKQCIRLPDPTIIFSKKEWEDIVKEENLDSINCDSYILLHFLNEPNEIAIDMIKEYLLKYDFNVLALAYNYEKYKDIKNIKFIDASPVEYIDYINNATVVLTDSFHTTLFSINLETNFLTFNRQHLHNFSQKGRVVDLLSRCNLKERFITEKQNIEKFNHDVEWNSDNIFKNEREKIRKYLNEKIKESEE